MRKSSVEVTFNNFAYWMNWYIDFLNKVATAERVVKYPREKKELFEAFALKVHVIWEIFIEELLVDCLNRDSSQYALYMGAKLPKDLSRKECKAMILGVQGYIDFRSVAEIKKISRNILVSQCNPFQAIPKSASDKIDEFYKIRNYLAHYSLAAKRSLANLYKNKYGMQRFREPGDFLFSFDKRSGQVRFGNYVEAFIDAEVKMAEFLGIQMQDG
jgi:hypothetical protein